jgi:glycosyltransferase involved in cell wall biosynthesis
MMSTTGIPCTVGILTYNNATSLDQALRSVASFAEVIVSDGGSTDGTLAIVESYGARIIPQRADLKNDEGRLIDFAGAMNQLIDEAEQPWVYKLESDEYLSETLVAELADALPSGANIDAFRVPFKYVVGEVVIEHASTYPASEPRLFRIGSGLRYERPVHERLLIDDDRTALLVQPHLKPLPTARQVAQKWMHYLLIEMRSARGIGLDEWKANNLRRHRWSAKYLTKQYLKILRSQGRPRMPARYELLRIANDLVAIPSTAVAAMWPGRDRADLVEQG